MSQKEMREKYGGVQVYLARHPPGGAVIHQVNNRMMAVYSAVFHSDPSLFWEELEGLSRIVGEAVLLAPPVV